MQYRATKNAYFHSYFPRTIREWNALPATVVEADSLARFQSGLHDYLDSDYKIKFSSKSGGSHLQEVVAYKRIPM